MRRLFYLLPVSRREADQAADVFYSICTMKDFLTAIMMALLLTVVLPGLVLVLSVI